MLQKKGRPHKKLNRHRSTRSETCFLTPLPFHYPLPLSYSQTQEKINFSMNSYFIKHDPFLHIPLFKTANPVEGAGG